MENKWLKSWGKVNLECLMESYKVSETNIRLGLVKFVVKLAMIVNKQ
jgi:hypothetical protein